MLKQGHHDAAPCSHATKLALEEADAGKITFLAKEPMPQLGQNQCLCARD